MKRKYANKLNLGAGTAWKKEGWEVIDHRTATLPFELRRQAWNLPFPDETFDYVFCSHVIEHISHYRIEKTLCEINRTMRKNGILRLLTPNLRTLATAYVNNDRESMQAFIDEDRSGIKTSLGLGQAFMNFLVSAGMDNIMVSSDYSEIIGGYAHVFCYDFEMLSGLLANYGYSEIRQSSIHDSAIEDHKDLRNDRYDVDARHSLVVECKKSEHVSFSSQKMLLFTGPYSLDKIIPAPDSAAARSFKCIGYIRNVFVSLGSWMPKPMKHMLRGILHWVRGSHE